MKVIYLLAAVFAFYLQPTFSTFIYLKRDDGINGGVVTNYHSESFPTTVYLKDMVKSVCSSFKSQSRGVFKASGDLVRKDKDGFCNYMGNLSANLFEARSKLAEILEIYGSYIPVNELSGAKALPLSTNGECTEDIKVDLSKIYIQHGLDKKIFAFDCIEVMMEAIQNENKNENESERIVVPLKQKKTVTFSDTVTILGTNEKIPLNTLNESKNNHNPKLPNTPPVDNRIELPKQTPSIMSLVKGLDSTRLNPKSSKGSVKKTDKIRFRILTPTNLYNASKSNLFLKEIDKDIHFPQKMNKLTDKELPEPVYYIRPKELKNIANDKLQDIANELLTN